MTIFIWQNGNEPQVIDDLRRICPDPGLAFQPAQAGWIPVLYSQTMSSVGCQVLAALATSPAGVGIRGLDSGFPVPSHSNPRRVLADVAGLTLFDVFPDTNAIEVAYDVGNQRGCNGRGYWVQGPMPATSLTIWIAAFIPRDISGLTRPVPGSPSMTMFDGPPGFGCFYTDHRDFSSAITSSRMRSRVVIDIVRMTLLSQDHDSNNTVSVDCASGAIGCNRKPDTSDLKVVNYTSTSNTATFTFSGAGHNPCVPLAPDINWSVNVRVNLEGSSSISVSVLNGSLVEPFPAFEMYVDFNGETKTLFTRPPDPGATPWNLFGDPNKAVTGSVTFALPSSDGKIDYPTDVSLFHELVHAKNLATEGFSGGLATGEQDALETENAYRAERGLPRRVGLTGGCNTPPPDKPNPATGSVKSSQRGRGGGGCFIATATLEGEFEAELDFLRHSRDTIILSTRRGRELFERFYAFYYTFSPGIADSLRRDPASKELILTGFVLPAMNYLKLAVSYPRSEIPALSDCAWHSYLTDLRDRLEDWSRACMPALVQLPEGYSPDEIERDRQFVVEHVLRSDAARSRFLTSWVASDYAPENAAELIKEREGDEVSARALQSLLQSQRDWIGPIVPLRALSERLLVRLFHFAAALTAVPERNEAQRWLGLAFIAPLANYISVVRSMPAQALVDRLPPDWALFVRTIEAGSSAWLHRVAPPRYVFPTQMTNDEVAAEVEFTLRHVLRDQVSRQIYLSRLEAAGIAAPNWWKS